MLPRSALLRCCLIVAALAITHPRLVSSQTPTPDLRSHGVRAYNRLPQNVTLSNARLFSEAMSYLFAYEQRVFRERGTLDDGTAAALTWMVSRIASLKTAKADGYDDGDLRRRGLAMLDLAKKSETNGRIWAVTAFVSAAANLYAYLECSPRPENDAIKGYEWLMAAQDRLIESGGSADSPHPEPVDWIPRSPRPRLGPRIAVMAGDVGGPGVSTASRAGALPRWKVAATTIVPERAQPADTVPPSIDTLGAIREQNEKLRAELSALQTENGQLRATIEELRQKLGTVNAERDARQARALQLYNGNQLVEARNMARSALQLDPGFGDAHMLIARIYAAVSAKGTTPEDGAVAWLAIDHGTHAVKAGAGDHAEGVAFLTAIEARTPTQDDLKRRGWVAGQKLRVSFPGYEWIDEETTIRARRSR